MALSIYFPSEQILSIGKFYLQPMKQLKNTEIKNYLLFSNYIETVKWDYFKYFDGVNWKYYKKIQRIICRQESKFENKISTRNVNDIKLFWITNILCTFTKLSPTQFSTQQLLIIIFLHKTRIKPDIKLPTVLKFLKRNNLSSTQNLTIIKK